MLDPYRNSVFRYVWNRCVRNSFYLLRETMGNRGGRWGQLAEYSGNPVYDVDYEWDSDSEERSHT